MADVAALERRIADLERQLADARRALEAGASGEVASEAGATPVLPRAARDELRHGERLLRAVFEVVHDAILLADDEGRCVAANRAACQALGIDEAVLAGHPIASLTRIGAHAGRSDEDAWAAFLARGAIRGELPVRRPDGSTRQLELDAVARILPGVHVFALRDVTDHRSAVESLQRTDVFLRTVLESAPLAMFALDLDSTFTFCAGAAIASLGIDPAALIGKRSIDLFGSLPGARLAREQIDRGETTSWKGDYAGVPLEIRVFPAMRGDEHVGAIGVVFDVSERKQAEEALRRSEQRFRALIEKSGDAVCLMDVEGVVTYVSPTVTRMLGYTPDELIGRRTDDYVHPDDRPQREERRAAVIGSPTPADAISVRARHKDGSYRYLEVAATDLLHDPAVGAIVANFRDVTDRVRAEEERRAYEARYRQIVEATSEGIWVADHDARTTFVNRRMAEILGTTPDAMLGRSVLEFQDEAAAAQTRQRFADRRDGQSEVYEMDLRRADGALVHVVVRASPWLAEDGAPLGALAIVSDVSEQRRLESQLAAIVENAEDAILSWDLHGTITTWNRGAERLYGHSREEAVGRSIAMLVPPDHEGEWAALLQRVASGERVARYETTRVRKDGIGVEVSLTLSPLRDVAGAIRSVSVIAHDLTDRRRAEAALRVTEEQLRQAQKMEAIGSLAGGVAHDFNNLLSVILGYAELALESLDPGEPLRADMEELQSAGMRARDLTRQLLALSRQQILQPRVVDIAQVLTGMERMLRRLLRADIGLSLLARRVGTVYADAGQLERVVLNLVINAVDAMPQGGRLAIELDEVMLDEREALDELGMRPGPHVKMTVRDTGIGMDAATRARIFEPFFTTKEKGSGTGLGLPTVFGIVRQSGGGIRVQSEPGVGTTFDVYLPRSERLEEMRVDTVALPSLRGTETILLVEHEEQVRVLARTVLRRQGYHVLEAGNGEEAFVLCEQFSGAIHLMLTGVVMPRMSGPQLAERVAPLRPDMRVVYMSDDTDDAITRHGSLDAGLEFLAKPITPEQLLRRVREVLDAPGRASPPLA